MLLPTFRYEEIKTIISDFLENYTKDMKEIKIPIDVFKITEYLNIKLVPFSILKDQEICLLKKNW